MIISVFTLAGVLVVSMVLFGFWLANTVFQFIWRSITGMVLREPTANKSDRHCANPGCRTINPLHANFCRRCGSNLSDAARNTRQPIRQPRYNPNVGRGRQAASV